VKLERRLLVKYAAMRATAIDVRFEVIASSAWQVASKLVIRLAVD